MKRILKGGKERRRERKKERSENEERKVPKKMRAEPSVMAEDRTVHWPDMAPQYQTNRGMGESEYNNTFAQQRSVSAPAYPKVKTAVMTLPLDPARFHKQRGSEYQFGNDERRYA
ncbi:hypothetical protein PoB_003969300 [Plakobranchus ocellatus]|uniref:Uncharacterized protein n=1 Tax=Plakobranchus ocellatus TaxID=259542 RepID=A0AAV4B245_9GAST|nr:hypothetical protein PoB_003969300 [Plakobranchus ocellatus]